MSRSNLNLGGGSTVAAMPKDTKTRYEGVYARHKQDCAIEAGGACSCKPSFYSRAWDSAAGKTRKTAFLGSPAAAKAARGDLERELASGRVPASQSMRVKAAIEAFLSAIENGRALNKHGRPYKPSAVRDLRGALENHVEDALGAKRIGDVRRGDVQRLVDDLTGKSGSRVRTIVNAIRSLYAWAEDRELVDHDPAKRIRLPAMDATPRDRVATVGEMQQLLAALDVADALPFAIAAYATARRAEIRHARLDDVDLKLGVIYLGADDRGRKSRAAQRAVPIAKPLRKMLRLAELAREPDAGDLLCPAHKPGGRNSGMLSFEALQTRADAAWGRAKLTRITAHECRHTCASWLDAAGVRPVVVSQLMGHAAPAKQVGAAEITQTRYTHSLPGDLDRAVALFDTYLRDQVAETEVAQ